MFPYKKPILGAQIALKSYFDIKYYDIVINILKSEDNVFLLDTNIQFDLNTSFFTIAGYPNNVLNSILNFYAYISELENENTAIINLFSVSGILLQEIDVYRSILQNAFLENKINCNLYTTKKSISLYQTLLEKINYELLEEKNYSNSKNNIILDYGFSHFIGEIIFITHDKQSLKALSEAITNKKFLSESNDKLNIYSTELYRTEHNLSSILIETHTMNIPFFLLFEYLENEAIKHSIKIYKTEFISLIKKEFLYNIGLYFYQKIENPKKILAYKEFINFGKINIRLNNFDDKYFYDSFIEQYIESYTTNQLETFCDLLADKEFHIGGGSAMAYNGAMAASLILLVIDTTINKKKFNHLKESLFSYTEKLQNIRNLFLESIDIDAQNLSYLLNNFSIVKNYEDKEKAMEIIHNACLTPLELIKLSSTILEITASLVENCSKAAISDLGIAINMIKSIANASLYNIWVNTKFDKEHNEQELIKEANNLINYINEMSKGIEEKIQNLIKE